MYDALNKEHLGIIAAALRSLYGDAQGSLLSLVYGYYKLMLVPWWVRMVVWMVKFRTGSTDSQAWLLLFVFNKDGKIVEAHMDALLDHILNGSDPNGAGGFNQKELDVIVFLLAQALAHQNGKENMK